MPVMPKADTVVAEAPLALLPVAVADALLAVTLPVELPVEEPVVEALAADEPPAAVLAPPLVAEPPSWTEVFKQLESDPAMMEA